MLVTYPRTADCLLAASSSLWIAQAAVLSYAIQNIADDGGIQGVIFPCFLFIGIGLLKSCLEASGARLALRTARRHLSTLRNTSILAIARRLPMASSIPSSGEVASIIGEQAEFVVPHYSRFLAARLKATILPPVILLFVLPVSWLTALLLMVSAPLIPIFMALIGWQAKAESEKQLTAMGGLNAFLLDRLRGLAT